MRFSYWKESNIPKQTSLFVRLNLQDVQWTELIQFTKQHGMHPSSGKNIKIV